MSADDKSGPAPEREEFMDVSRIHAAIMREKDEPTDGYEPIPTTWLALVIALAMWGGWYLGSYNYSFRLGTLDGSVEVATGAETQKPKALDPVVLGKRVFNNCMACHQATGTGIAGQFPPLDASEWVSGDSQSLVRILLHGLSGPITVKGEHYNGGMPAWAGKLSDEQIAGVLTYIRGAWSNKAGPVAAEEVAAMRKHESQRRDPWTQAQLQSVAGTP